MNRHRIATAIALGSLGLALLFLAIQPARRDTPDRGATDGTAPAAIGTDSPVPSRSARILRSSLSMPYFSFARQLRTRN